MESSKARLKARLLKREHNWNDSTLSASTCIGSSSIGDSNDSRLVKGARRIYGSKTPIEKVVVTASPSFPLGDHTPFLPVLWTKKDVATRVQSRNDATRALKKVSLKPTARTLRRLRERVRDNAYEMNAVPSIKSAIARASRDVRALKQSLRAPSDVTTSTTFQNSLSKTCRVAAEASSSVHDLQVSLPILFSIIISPHTFIHLQILVDVQERKLKEEYERAVRRLDGERAILMSEVVEPAQRKLHELRRKIDTYEGLESCPLVEHALRMSAPALREAKRLVTIPASELVKNAVSERGTLSHKRLERILEDVQRDVSEASKRVDELAKAISDEIPHLVLRIRRDDEQRRDLNERFAHSSKLLEKIERVIEKNFALRSFTYLTGFIGHAREEVDRASLALSTSASLVSNRALRRGLEDREKLVLSAVERTNKALAVLKKIDLSSAKTTMSKVHSVLDRNRDRGALHELPEVRRAVRLADELMIETNNKLIWLVKCSRKAPWELQERMNTYRKEVEIVKEMSNRALRAVLDAEVGSVQEFRERAMKEREERVELESTIPKIETELNEIFELLESHRHLGIESDALDREIQRLRRSLEEACTFYLLLFFFYRFLLSKRSHACSLSLSLSLSHTHTYTQHTGTIRDEKFEIHVANSRRDFDAKVRRMRVVREECEEILKSVRDLSEKHEDRVSRVKEIRLEKEEEQKREIRVVLRPGSELLERIEVLLREDPEILEANADLLAMSYASNSEEVNRKLRRVELISTRLDALRDRMLSVNAKLSGSLAKDLSHHHQEENVVGSPGNQKRNRRRRRRRRDTTFVLEQHAHSAKELKEECAVVTRQVSEMWKMVSERKSEIEKEREKRIEFVGKKIEQLKSEIQDVEFEAMIVQNDFRRLSEETKVPVVSESVSAGLNFVRRVKISLNDVDMSSDVAARATLEDRTKSVKRAKQETKIIRTLVNWVDLSVLRCRVEMMRSDMNSSPHELWRSKSLRDVLIRCDESINGVHEALRSFSMSQDFPVSVLASYLWSRMEGVSTIKGAWHCVARANGWISRAERKMKDSQDGTGKNKKKKKKERRVSRYMMSTSSSRSTRHRRATFNEKKLAEAILNSTELDQNIQVSLHYDKTKRKEASGNAARAALNAVPHAMKHKRVAELAISCDARFEDLTGRYQDAHALVKEAQEVLNEERSGGASNHLKRRKRLNDRKLEMRRTKLDVYRDELKRVLSELRGRWDGLGTSKDLLSAIREAQVGVKHLENVLLHEESPDPTTEALCLSEIKRWDEEAKMCKAAVGRMNEVYLSESARFNSSNVVAESDEN